jgi:hypothetical protein
LKETSELSQNNKICGYKPFHNTSYKVSYGFVTLLLGEKTGDRRAFQQKPSRDLKTEVWIRLDKVPVIGSIGYVHRVQKGGFF